MRRLFHNDLTAQGGKLMDTLDAVASSLDHFESLRPRLARLGRLHASCGVRPARYDALITALLWAFGQALGAGCCYRGMIESAVILRPCWMKGGIGS